jgi:hypothetical protein
MQTFPKGGKCRTAGVTIIESVIASALVVIVLGGLFVLQSEGMRRLKAQKETAVASLCLQHRLEQIRSANWTNITSAAAVRGLLNAPVPGADVLPAHEERIKISIYPPPNPEPTPISVVRNATGTVLIESAPAGTALVKSLALRVDVRESWTSGQGGRRRVRETSTVVALGGIVK